MDILQAIILGLVQGITEFLPISSSGHLRLAPAVFGWQDPGAAFTAVIQLGTLLAVLIYFRKDLGHAIVAWAKSFRRTKGTHLSHDEVMGWAIFVGTIPIAILGYLLRHQIEGSFRSLYVVAAMLIGIGILMGIAEFVGSRRKALADVTVRDGLVVGLWQCIALIPGASRSGSTMTGALFLGFDRATAAKFSFLLSVPSIFLAAVFQVSQHREVFTGALAMPAVVANITSFLSGYAAIAFLIKFLQTQTSWIFIAYRILLGIALLGLLSQGYLLPTEVDPSTKTAALPNKTYVSTQAN